MKHIQTYSVVKLAPIILFLFATFMSCEKPPGALTDFYFPSEHKVYVYTANDSTGREYWEVTPDAHDGLVTTIYSGNLIQSQYTVEKKYANGMNLEVSKMTQGKNLVDVEIESGFIFPFYEIDSNEVLFYKINWESLTSDGSITNYELIRNRRFIGYENREVLGNIKSCAKFKLDERIISNLDGSIELKLKGVEYYAKNIGLVYRRRSLTEDTQFEQELIEVLSPKEFDTLKSIN